MSNITIDIALDTRSVNRMFNGLNNQFNNLSRNATMATSKASDGFKSLGNTVKDTGKSILQFGSALAAAGIGIATKHVFDLTSSFEKYQTVLANTFQNQEAANIAMKGLQDFAAVTPFSLNEITQSYIKLVNRGLVPTQQELTALGDFTAKSGKDFDQLSEAILDVSNPERWKEFGVVAKKNGNKVSLTVNGITKTVEHSVQGVKQAIVEFGKMEGTAGGMAAVSKTLGGQWSNLTDSFDQAAVAIGKQLSPVITPMITKLSDFIQKIIPDLTKGTSKLVNLFGKKLPVAFKSITASPLFMFLKNQAVEAFKIVMATGNSVVQLFQKHLPESMESITTSPVFGFIQTTIIGSFDRMKQTIGSTLFAIDSLWTGLQNLWAASPALQGFVKGVASLATTVGETFSELLTLVTGAFDGIVKFFTQNKFGIAITNFFIEPIKDAIEGIKDLFSFVNRALKGINKFFGFTKKSLALADEPIKQPEVIKKDTLAEKREEKKQSDLTFDTLQSLIKIPKAPATPITQAAAPKTDKEAGARIMGRQPKTININIENVIDTVSISQAQDPLEVKDLVTRAIQTAILDASKFA